MPAQKLTDSQLQALGRRRRKKPYKVFDGLGLYVEVPPVGHLRWRYKYRFQGREKLLSLGVYPAVTLKDARAAHREAYAHVELGRDPSAIRQAEVRATKDSFEAVAREWHHAWAKDKDEDHAVRNLRRLEVHVFASIGRQPIAAIAPEALLNVLKGVADGGNLETAHRLRTIFGQVYRHAILHGYTKFDPTTALRDGLPASKATNYPAITDPHRLGQLLLAIDGYKTSFPMTALALRLAPLVFVRPFNLHHAEWSEIKLDGTEPSWTIPRVKLKRSEVDLIVPLARQAVALLEAAKAQTGAGRYVFSSTRDASRPLSNATLGAALRTMGFSNDEVVVHGFRATARTMIAERLHVRVDFIEHQLNHAVRGPNGRAYDRTEFIAERRDMMQRWADYLDTLRARARE